MLSTVPAQYEVAPNCYADNAQNGYGPDEIFYSILAAVMFLSISGAYRRHPCIFPQLYERTSRPTARATRMDVRDLPRAPC